MKEDTLIERIRVKMQNLEEGKNEPVPEEFTFNNIVHGQVVRRVMKEMEAAYQFNVKFELNGIPVDVTVQLSNAELAASTSNSRRMACTALAKVMAAKLAAVMVEKIVTVEAEHQFRGTRRT